MKYRDRVGFSRRSTLEITDGRARCLALKQYDVIGRRTGCSEWERDREREEEISKGAHANRSALAR